VTACRTGRGPLATLGVTLSTRDHVKSEIKVTHQCVSSLSEQIRNIINNFVWDVIAIDFYNFVSYSLPRCDFQLHVEHKYTIFQINTQYNVLVNQMFLIVTLFQLHSLGIRSI